MLRSSSPKGATWFRQLVVALTVLIVASCSGGGCSSGCSGCGVTPLPGGYPKANTVVNAASVRITRAGLDFVGDNLGAIAGKALMGQNGVISFNIPSSTNKQTLLGFFDVTLKICPNGPNPNANPKECIADVMISGAKLHLDAASYAQANGEPALRISGTIPLRVQNLPVNVDTTLGSLGDFGLGVGKAGNPQCNGGTPNYDYFDFPIEVILPLISETIQPRDGYTKIDTKNAIINPTLTAANVGLCKNCGFAQNVCNAIFNFVIQIAFNSIIAPLKTQLKTTLEDQLCTKPNPNVNPQCPTGSQVSGSKCVYTSDPNTCVPMLLGTDGHMDLSSALASLSPGTSGALDFVLAAGGDMMPAPNAAPDNQGWPGHTPNGVTLGFLGGVTAMPPNGCVPIANVTPPTGIPIPDEMLSNTVTPWPAMTEGPQLGIALAGRFLDYALAGVYNSGLLCLGITTEQIPQLHSGVLSFLIPGFKKLTYEQKAAPIAITTRPQKPPHVKIGTGADLKNDPLLRVQLDQFAVDFYVWSMDRFVRAMTFTADIGVPVNLSTAKDMNKNPNGGLLPSIGDLDVQNAQVTNSDLLTDDPKIIASGLGPLLGGLVGQFAGAGFKPVDLSSSLKTYGLTLTIPDTGIRKLTKNTDDFLAIFANLGQCMGCALYEADVAARLVGKEVDPAALSLPTFDRAKGPTLHVLASSALDDGTRAIEYSWRIDQGTRSEWKASRDLVVAGDAMFLQGKHVLSVYAREHGNVESESSVPALVPYTVDVLPPVVSLEDDGHGTVVRAWDVVSDTDALVARVKVGGGAFGDWTPLAKLSLGDLSGAKDVTVEVKDEEGNVGTATSALIRGRPDGTQSSSGGCGCTTAETRPMSLWNLLPLAGVFALLRRRQKGRAGRTEDAAPRPFDAPNAAARLRAAGTAVLSVAALAAANPGCNCGDQPDARVTGCGADCNSPCDDPLPQGLIGAYTAAAVGKDGRIWFAGYNDAVLSSGLNALYGDLVAGTYDLGKKRVAWQSIDGLPPTRKPGPVAQGGDGCPTNDPRGWRMGETDPGPDVGLWTTMQLTDKNEAMIAYYDGTSGALRFALYDGWNATSYEMHKVPGGDAGRYAKMILVNGLPVVAFLQMEKGNMGRTRSKIVVARAAKSPPELGDWTFEDAAVDETAPCQPQFCGAGEVCVKATGQCQATVGGCTPADCGTGNACVTVMSKATCSAILPKDAPSSYPNAVGLYVSLAQAGDHLGLVAYDRYRGNLLGLSNAGGKWTVQILDGQTGANDDPKRMDTGDVGIGASLVVTSNGDWHIAYVNGLQETLQYLLVPGGGKPLKPEVVDDGLGGGTPYPDGKHIIGDDATLEVDPNSGTVTIAYQDATGSPSTPMNQSLRVATGTVQNGGTHKWSSRAIAQPGKNGGFFPRFVGGNQVANFYRSIDRTSGDTSGDVAVVTY